MNSVALVLRSDIIADFAEKGRSMWDKGAPIEAIHQSWCETMGDIPFEATLRWEDSGADSLRSMVFLLRLEQLLGRVVPLDLIGPNTTPLSLANAITGGLKGAAVHQGVHTYFIPGMGGDEPQLSALRRALSPELSFTTLILPDLNTSQKVLTCVAATARSLRRQIKIDNTGRPVTLMGFSFGGLVAVELASQLQTEGILVQQVLLLDPLLFLGRGFRAYFADRLLSVAGRTKHDDSIGPIPRSSVVGKKGLESYLVGGLCRVQAHGPARLLFPLFARGLSPEKRLARRLQLLTGFRSKAMRRWRPSPYIGRVVLIASDDPRAQKSVPRWRVICPSLQVTRVAGFHSQLLKPASIKAWRPTLLQTLLWGNDG